MLSLHLLNLWLYFRKAIKICSGKILLSKPIYIVYILTITTGRGVSRVTIIILEKSGTGSENPEWGEHTCTHTLPVLSDPPSLWGCTCTCAHSPSSAALSSPSAEAHSQASIPHTQRLDLTGPMWHPLGSTSPCCMATWCPLSPRH